MVNHPAPWRNVRTILPYNTATAPVFPLHSWARYNLEQYVPSSQTYFIPVYPTRQYSTYLVHKHTHFRCTYTPVQYVSCSQIYSLPVYPTRQYSVYLTTNILTSGVPYTPVQYVPCSQTYSLPVYPTRQYSTYLIHKYTHFRCILHASTVGTLFTNILTSGVSYTPVQYVPCSQT